MSYRSDGNGYRGVTYSVGGLFGLFLAWRLVSMVMMAASGPGEAAPDLTTPAGVEQALFADKDEAGELYRTVKRTYPDEFEGLKREVAREARAGQPVSVLDGRIVAYMIAAKGRHRRDMIQAPHAELTSYRAKEIEILEALRRTDPALCATYVTTGTAHAGEHNPALSALMLDFQRVGWEAMAAGRDRPANRKIARASAQDIRDIRRDMEQHGIAPAVADRFFSGLGAAVSSNMEKCDTAIAFLRAVARLPEERADRIFASMAQQAS